MKKKTEVPPSPTLEGREGQLINYAVDLAEKQLRNGNASAQVITHFLKQGTVRSQLELEKLKQENLLLEAKTEAIKSSRRLEDLYLNALSAMKDYQGIPADDEDL